MTDETQVEEIHPGVRSENMAVEAASPQQAPEPVYEETLHPGVRSELLGGGTVIEQVAETAEAAEATEGKPSRRKKAE